MAQVDRSWGIPPELAVAALVGAATLPMTRLFTDGLAGAALLATTMSLGLSWGLRRLGVNPIAAWSISMLALIWVLSIRFFPGTLLGPFPSLETLGEIGVAVREGARQTIEEIAPVDPTTPLLLFVTAGVWLTAWLVHTALTSLRNPLLAVASAMPLFAIPGAIVPGARLWLEASLFLLAAGAVLFIERRSWLARWSPVGAREEPGWTPGPALRLGLLGALLAGLAAPSLPGFGTEPAFGGTGAGSQVYFNPIVAIKPSLDDERDIELFRVHASEPTYYRLTALDVFDGDVWKPRESRPVAPLGGYTPRSIGETDRVRQEIQIVALAGPWLPAAYQPVYVARHQPTVETHTDTLLVDDRLRPGLEYIVESNVPRPSVEELDRPVTYDRGVHADLLSLPRSLPPRILEIAREITEGARTPYQRALAIQRHLRGFRYDENIARGHSFGDMVAFLDEVQAGYCEQFAGSMAVLARALGIPSRVAIGFGIGEQIDVDTWRITTRHAHAWVEVFFPQAGWVAFEPTPRAGITQLPAYAPPEEAEGPDTPDNDDDENQDRNPPRDEPTPDASTPGDEDIPGAVYTGGGLPSWVPLTLLALGIVAGAGIGPLATRVRRRRRLRAATSPRALVSAHYFDFLEWCAAAGLGREAGETPREHGSRVGRLSAAARDPLDRLVEEVDEALWAPPNGQDPTAAAAAAAQAKAALTPLLSRTGRVKVRARWGSLLDRG